MITPDDHKLRDAFQAQRLRESARVPTFDTISSAGGRRGACPAEASERRRIATVLPFRMVIAASIMICVGLTLAVRLWFVSTQLIPPSTELAALSDWSPVTDSLLDMTPASINDATFITEHLLVDETYNETHNTEEVL